MEKEKQLCISHQAHAQRIFDLFKFLPNRFGFGSLWWVDEELWKEKIPRYDSQSTRKAHPGLSIRQTPLVSPYEAIPFLHGTSKKGGKSIMVHGLSKDENHTSYFGRIKSPIFIGLEFVLKKVHPNKKKPQLNHDEQKALHAWLKEKGLS